jgi:hypothetical protein
MEAAMEACAHAAAGDAKQCHRALGDAAEAVALLAIDQDAPDWLDFDEGGYWGHRCHEGGGAIPIFLPSDQGGA